LPNGAIMQDIKKTFVFDNEQGLSDAELAN
jgi:hypothetical protein